MRRVPRRRRLSGVPRETVIRWNRLLRSRPGPVRSVPRETATKSERAFHVEQDGSAAIDGRVPRETAVPPLPPTQSGRRAIRRRRSFPAVLRSSICSCATRMADMAAVAVAALNASARPAPRCAWSQRPPRGRGPPRGGGRAGRRAADARREHLSDDGATTALAATVPRPCTRAPATVPGWSTMTEAYSQIQQISVCLLVAFFFCRLLPSFIFISPLGATRYCWLKRRGSARPGAGCRRAARAAAAARCGRRSAGRRGRRGSGRRATSSSRSRLVAAIRRTSTGTGTARAERRHLALLDGAQELRLQRERDLRRPRRGTACRPRRRGRRRRGRVTAPVKAPRRWPKSWLSSSVSERPAQLMATNGARGERARAGGSCARRAPCRCRSRRVTSTVLFVLATASMSAVDRLHRRRCCR